LETQVLAYKIGEVGNGNILFRRSIGGIRKEIHSKL
jgi:hypothetical protein